MEEPSPDASATVQHVDRKCSDQLLSKFADSGDRERKDPRAPKRRRKDQRVAATVLLPGERRSLLPPAEQRSAFLRQLGAIRPARPCTRKNIRNRSLLGAIEKTWRRTVEGASRAFVEKHYNRHKRLISDAV